MKFKFHFQVFSIVFAAIMICNVLSAQAPPQGINYQAVARNSSGTELANTALTVRMGIYSDAAATVQVYEETHAVTTNAFGLFNLIIGQGTQTSVGAFNAILWANSAYYMKVEINGGTGFTDMGTTQLMSVPYALYAGSSAGGPTGPQGATGLQGATGTTGIIGATGAQGVAGAQGATGPQGNVGANGATGATGAGIHCWDLNNDGVNDAAEDINNDGFWNSLDCVGATGAQGIAGPSGSQGGTGANGATGVTGSNGNDGIHCWDLNGDGVNDAVEDVNSDGLWNSLDCIGATGAQGIAGATGSNGATGTAGPTGATGTTGTNGATGAVGPTGANGVTGVAGPTGANGATGTAGTNGATGAVGPTGANGATGTAGTNGANGATGAAGPSGANGTNGATGATGPSGTVGATGTAGTTGATGATGPTAPGVTGQTLYYSATNTLTATSNLFHNGSNVGIGTTSPARVAGADKYLTVSSTDVYTTAMGAIEIVGANTAASGIIARLDFVDVNAGPVFATYGRIAENAGGDMLFSTKGASLTERMRITGSGAVGIGITAPFGMLNVVDNTGTGVSIIGESNNAGNSSIYVNSTGAAANSGFGYERNSFLKAYTGVNVSNDWYMNVGSFNNAVYAKSSNGFVGINTSSPQSVFEVATDGTLINGMRISNASSTQFGPTLYFDAQNNDWAISATNASASVGGNKLSFRNYTGSLDVMTLDPGGNIGIGIGNPNVKLDILAPESGGIDITSPANAKLRSSVNSVSGGQYGMVTNHDLSFFTNNTPRISISGAGNIGIGGSYSSSYRTIIYGSNEALGTDGNGIIIGDIFGNSSGQYFSIPFENNSNFLMMGGNLGIGITPTQRLELNGNVQIPAASDYKYATAKTHYYSVPGMGFNSEAPNTYERSLISGNIYLSSGTTTAVGYVDAPVNLPDGATVTSVIFYVVDNDGTYNTQSGQLWRNDASLFSSYGNSSTMASTPLPASTNSTLVQACTTSSISNPVIDNQNYSYWLRWGTQQSNANLRLVKVLITYTVTKAD